MLKCEILDVQGFDSAVEGMRNPKNSWDRSDSYYELANFCDSAYVVGENDLTLMQNLFKAGTEHRKYLRMIVVWVTIDAPFYWWKEYDTYKI